MSEHSSPTEQYHRNPWDDYPEPEDRIAQLEAELDELLELVNVLDVELDECEAENERLRAGIQKEFGNEKRWRYDGTTWRFYGEDPVAIVDALTGGGDDTE
jgi:hypothetical protein